MSNSKDKSNSYYLLAKNMFLAVVIGSEGSLWKLDLENISWIKYLEKKRYIQWSGQMEKPKVVYHWIIGWSILDAGMSAKDTIGWLINTYYINQVFSFFYINQDLFESSVEEEFLVLSGVEILGSK